MPTPLRSLAFVALLVCGLVPPALAGDPLAGAPTDPAKVLEALKSKEPAARLAGARDARSVQDEKLVAPLAALLSDEDPVLRQAAIDALGHRTGAEDQRKAASALAAHLPRVARKANADVETIATAQALGALAQPSSLDALLADIELDTPTDVVDARLDAVAQIPAADAIEALIQFLAKNGRGRNGQQRDACRRALRAATGENFGNEPDAWRAWWKDAKKTFDFDAAVRRRAAERQKEADAEQRRKDRKEKKEGGGDGGGKK